MASPSRFAFLTARPSYFALSLAVPLCLLAETANAQIFFFDEPRRSAYRPDRSVQRAARPRLTHERRERRPREAAPASDKVAAAQAVSADRAPAKAKPVEARPAMTLAVVSLSNQHVSVYGENGLITRSPVSTGQSGHRTPTGIFTILEKQRWHESNIYSGAAMPFMQRITWSGIALHQGVVPGYPASHGCIRLPQAFAARLWEMTRVGLRVVVAPEDIQPVPIAHPALPLPTLVPETAIVSAGAAHAPALAERATAAPASIHLASVSSEVPKTAETTRLLNPPEVATRLKAQAAAALPAARKAAEQALATARAAAAAADQSVAAVKLAKAALDEARERQLADEELVALQRRLTDAQAEEESKVPRSYELAEASRQAERAVSDTQEAIEIAARRQAPVSILISRKEGSILIKQGRKLVFEAPIEISEPERPLGTHLFVANAVAEGGQTLEWTALSVPASEAGKSQRPRKAARKGEPEEPPAPSLPPSTATEVLERITMSEAARREVAQLMWVGGSLIVTDKGLSLEDGAYTDVIVSIP